MCRKGWLSHESHPGREEVAVHGLTERWCGNGSQIAGEILGAGWLDHVEACQSVDRCGMDDLLLIINHINGW